MNGEQLMERILDCEQARKSIPLELQASLPLPGRMGSGSAECWYYRMECNADGVRIYSPALWVLWDVKTMNILKMRKMEPVLLGSGADVLTREHRIREDAYLEKLDAACPQGDEALTKQWMDAAPQVLRAWLESELKRA